jgi:hypothetical protein
MKKTITVVCLLLSIVTLSRAQSNAQSRELGQRKEPIDCESFLALLDYAIMDWRNLEGTHLILIARLGTGEYDRKLNLARLRYVEDYLKKKDVQYVLAEGSRVDGLGKFEVYVGGRLQMSIALKRGVIRLCFGSTG